ncbi:hypothetical protein DR085_00815 [Mycoplasma flocculare]|uniref:hypothetical protein n=1 Tax=Mesomycoplasma flocculare TaxID=2128 RepID=UPI00136CABF1|nr:hypothetical protein [Mesomycoplasma flocculare]MXR13422.1 hypothetical protein [Mesomycoplasma flocculare]
MLYIEIIGYIAAFLTAIVGLPLVINTFKTKIPPKVSLLSWWIYYIGILAFALLGLALNDFPLIITQVFCGLITITFLVQYYTFLIKKSEKTQANLAFIGLGIIIYFLILLTLIFYFAKTIPAGKMAPGATYIGIIAGFCVNIAFLPQTLLGIKQKTIKFIPLTFLLNLTLLNIFWIIYEFLKLLVEENSNYLSALIFQIIGFIIAVSQLFVYFYQLSQQRKIEKTFKINWI